MILALILTFCSWNASAESLPLREMEEIRKLLVVTRMALSESANLKKCEYEGLHGLGAQLQLLSANFFAENDSKKISNSADLKILKKKINNCIYRASCWIYSEYLKNDDRSQVKALASLAKAKNDQLKEYHYRSAFKKIKSPCLFIAKYIE
ncbi:MAG: hypothetical protein M9962_08840 [Oligoflexia bacterium]|nr:hypothetical protein [Oligoflexia bacterium]